MVDWTHDGLADDLAEHLRQTSGRLVWTNMPMGPAGTVRPDVFTLPRCFSRFVPLTYEVKISVADFRADTTAGKWTEYLAFSAGVVFAVPTGLIGKADLPPGCGLMTRGETGWRTVKAPTVRPVDNLPRDTWMKILFDGLERRDKERRLEPRSANDWQTAGKMRKAMGADVAAIFKNRDLIADNAQKLFALLRLSDKHTGDIRESYWHLAASFYHVGKTLEGGAAGRDPCEDSTLPDYGDFQRVREKVSRLKPGTSASAVRDFLAGLRRDIDRAESQLVPVDLAVEP